MCVAHCAPSTVDAALLLQKIQWEIRPVYTQTHTQWCIAAHGESSMLVCG